MKKINAQKSGNQTPNLSALAQWLYSWIQPDGAIHGYHNHSVWGDHPYRYDDHSCGHSTFASPLLPALAEVLRQQPHPAGEALLRRLIDFQIDSVQSNGIFDHVGFQVGDRLKNGLIHIAVPQVTLLLTAQRLGDGLSSSRVQRIRDRVLSTMERCDTWFRPVDDGEWANPCCNQEYTRIWARLLFMDLFDDDRWDDLCRKGLHALIDRLHVRGLPDADSVGPIRGFSTPNLIEPAEYIGLMINPLLLGAERYQEPRFLDEAQALARHVLKSAWTDALGCRRLHRNWVKVNNEFCCVREPMLIGGMGVTLDALDTLYRKTGNEDLARFLTEMDATYARYQSPTGFFLAATGWSRECDIIPASAWQSHDLFYLTRRHGVQEGFWDDMMKPLEGCSVVLGSNCTWMEDAEHWRLRGTAELVGRKDSPTYYTELPHWIAPQESTPPSFILKDTPTFLVLDERLVHESGREDLTILNHDSRSYEGPATLVVHV